MIARAAPGAGRAAIRLGATARSLLRRPAGPVVVVPPDLAPAAVGAGPIVGLTALRDADVAACRLARALADATGRDLALLHAVEAGGAEEPLARGEASLARWSAEHGVWPELTAVTAEDPVAAAVAFSEARRAPLVVAAAPASPPLDAFTPKRWRRLAALARQAVLVAPAPEGARLAAEGDRGARRGPDPVPPDAREGAAGAGPP